MTLRIGTRGSTLALAQTGHVADALQAATGEDVEIVTVTTHGDTSRESLSTIGGTGVFVNALRDALLDDVCDLVVHSLKDLPTASIEGFTIAAVPPREDPRDALCATDGRGIDDLPAGARIGTGSPRRIAQLRAARPDLEIVDIRGNIDSRLRRVVDGELDAVVLAAAGLTRIDRLDAVTGLFDIDSWPTAPGQGALAIECLDREDSTIVGAVSTLEHAPSRWQIAAERAVLRRLEAGCAAPVGAAAWLDGDELVLQSAVYSLDGTRSIRKESRARGFDGDGHGRELLHAADALGIALADELIGAGAADLAPLGPRSGSGFGTGLGSGSGFGTQSDGGSI
ncbi:hydroxymethylbilane synthase [Plantibacter sp. Mn2098]|uniref:hydroxymethylbilane synthase n=1 Tax=Plantibacter sp. Mn2098 TaxID=3395266 RepID=UPI003BD8C25D